MGDLGRKPSVRIIVYHATKGCESGCCGHVIEVELEGDESHELRQHEGLELTHPYGEDPRTWAEDLVRERFGEKHVADLDWDGCLVVDD